MYFVGIDLSWGGRQPTGLAVVDTSGLLVHVSAVRTDEEIFETLASYVEGDCLVAIDAPLVVKNATGNRVAEAALNRDFARFQAGAHPSNTAKAEFASQPRGRGWPSIGASTSTQIRGRLGACVRSTRTQQPLRSFG